MSDLFGQHFIDNLDADIVKASTYTRLRESSLVKLSGISQPSCRVADVDRKLTDVWMHPTTIFEFRTMNPATVRNPKDKIG